MTLRYSLLMLDFDGTLVDSERCIALSLERALDECGRTSDLRHLRGYIGLPLDTILRSVSAGIDPAGIEAVTAAYRRHYAALEQDLIDLFPGAREALREMHAQGVRLAIATNKFTARTEATVARLGIDSLFSAVVGADQVANPKPHADIAHRVLELTRASREAALVVGDTLFDLEMAARADLAACAVTWGNHSREQLATARPAFIIDAFSELLAVAGLAAGAPTKALGANE